MLQKEFFEHYLKSPFFLWAVIMFVITTFDSAVFSNIMMQTIVLYQLYVPILFGSLTVAFIFSLYPIQRGLVEYGRKENKKIAILFIILISLIFIVDSIYFLIDPYIIFGKLSPGVIPEKVLNYTIYAQTLSQFLAIPLLSALNFTIIKNKLSEKGYEINDTFRNNMKFIAYNSIIFITIYTLDVLITRH